MSVSKALKDAAGQSVLKIGCNRPSLGVTSSDGGFLSVYVPTKKAMKSLKIEHSSFGCLVINGKQYTSDLIIYPDGRIEDPWYRRSGHRLSSDDIGTLIEFEPEVIIAGTGVSGEVRPEKELEELLSKKGIQFIHTPNEKARALYNSLAQKKRVGACFHLTC